MSWHARPCGERCPSRLAQWRTPSTCRAFSARLVPSQMSPAFWPRLNGPTREVGKFPQTTPSAHNVARWHRPTRPRHPHPTPRPRANRPSDLARRTWREAKTSSGSTLPKATSNPRHGTLKTFLFRHGRARKSRGWCGVRRGLEPTSDTCNPGFKKSRGNNGVMTPTSRRP